jgi:outer membrane receptor protein involved in Fe transport
MAPPLGDKDILNFSYDYRRDYTSSASSDQTGAAPGCSFVIGSVSGTGVYGAGGVPFQPGCSTAVIPTTSPFVGYNKLPQSAIGVPPTVAQFWDLALTGTFQLTDRLTVALGNYFEIWNLAAQIENPAVLIQYAGLGNSAAAPVALIPGHQNYDHYDPHAGLTYRVNPNLILRASAGSSITAPYASIVSGFGSVTQPNVAQPNYSQSIPNFNLKPETTVAYDAGFDYRLPDGGVFSLDAYDDTVHNVFLTSTTFIAPIPGITPFPGFTGTGFQQNNYYNGPLERSYGLEASLTSVPKVGLGYYVSASLNRQYYVNIPLSFYVSNTTPTSGNFIINGAQVFGNPFFKSYSQLLVTGKTGFIGEIGMDWEGQDNANLGPPYVLWDASVRIPMPNYPALKLQLSVQNLANYNNGTALARTLSGQGWIEPTVYLSNGQLFNSGSATGLQAVPPQTFRFSLTYDFP